MSNCNKHLLLFCISSFCLILALCCFLKGSISDLHAAAELSIIPGNSSMYIKKYDLTIKGQDKDGITYFFLPSYADAEIISQRTSQYKVYCMDDSLLSKPAYGVVQEVTVDPGDGNRIPWKISFMHSANLYTANIELNDADVYSIDHDKYTPSSLSVYSPYGKMEYTSDSVLIKGRGNTTWDAVKQPYEIKLPDTFPLCGMDSSSKWVLLANFFDDTKILNKMAMDLSDSIGMEYAIQSDWIDLYINGEYRGNYLLCKEPGISKGRLRINDGFLVEKDVRGAVENDPNSFMSGDDLFRIKDPLPISENEKVEISFYVKSIDTKLHNMSSSEPFTDINSYSFTRRFMIDEFFNNPDSMQMSCYFYKHEGVLYAGPCWDYDLSCGKSLNGMDYYDHSKSILDDLSKDSLDWDSLLMQNHPYKADYDALFTEACPILFDSIQNRVDTYAEKISPSVEMDRALWQNDEIPVRFYASTSNKYRFVKYYLYERLKLLASECDYGSDLPVMDLSDNTIHTVSFKTESDLYSIEVSDGSLLSEAELPPYDKTRYSGWMYIREQKPFSPYLPVYEDISLELLPLQEDE